MYEPASKKYSSRFARTVQDARFRHYHQHIYSILIGYFNARLMMFSYQESLEMLYNIIDFFLKLILSGNERSSNISPYTRSSRERSV